MRYKSKIPSGGKALLESGIIIAVLFAVKEPLFKIRDPLTKA